MKKYPPCPRRLPGGVTCGNRQRSHVNTGWANEGTIPVRSYNCANGHVELTAEVPVLGNTSITSLDGNLRRHRRAYRRKSDGYQGGPPRTQRFESDELMAHVTVVKGRSTWKGRKAA